ADRLGPWGTRTGGACTHDGVNKSGRIATLAYNVRRVASLRLFKGTASPQYGRAKNHEEDHHGCWQEESEEVEGEESEEGRRAEEEGRQKGREEAGQDGEEEGQEGREESRQEGCTEEA